MIGILWKITAFFSCFFALKLIISFFIENKIEKYQEAYGTTLPRMRGQRDNQLKRKQTSPLRRRGPRENQLTQKQNSPLRMRGP